MKKFTQLALVSSLAISANAMAMQAMDDAALSASTGQDGINIGIGISKVQIDKLYIHDNDGLAADATNTYTPVSMLTGSPVPGAPVTTKIVGGTGKAGAIGIDGITITANYGAILSTTNLMDLQIDSDAGTGDKGAFLNIAAQVSGLDIKIGAISVSASNDAASTGRRGVSATNSNQILSGLNIKTGQMAANIQLGSTPQGAMIKLDTSMKGGLEISDLGILDNAGGGQVTLGKISLNDANSADLSINADVSVTNKGLAITSHQNEDGTDIYIQGINLGAAPAVALGDRGTARAGSIGDVEIQGLKTFYGAGYANQGSVITVSGR